MCVSNSAVQSKSMLSPRLMIRLAAVRQVCDTPDKSFMLINQKGIDPMALDMLAKEVLPTSALYRSLSTRLHETALLMPA